MIKFFKKQKKILIFDRLEQDKKIKKMGKFLIFNKI